MEMASKILSLVTWALFCRKTTHWDKSSACDVILTVIAFPLTFCAVGLGELPRWRLPTLTVMGKRSYWLPNLVGTRRAVSFWLNVILPEHRLRNSPGTKWIRVQARFMFP